MGTLPVIAGDSGLDGKSVPQGKHGLTAEQMAACRALDMTVKDYRAALGLGDGKEQDQ